MADKSNPCAEVPLTVGAGDGGCQKRVSSPGFASLASLFSGISSVCLTQLSAFVDRVAPEGSVLGIFLPAVRVHVEGLQGGLQRVLVALFLASEGALALLQFAIENLSRQPVVWHASEVACPTKLGFHQHGVDAGHAGSGKDFGVRNHVLPSDPQYSPKAGYVEVVELLGMALVDCPSLACVQQCWEDDGAIHLQLGGKADASSVPDAGVKSAKGCTGFGDTRVHFIINHNTAGQCAAKVGEFFYRVQSLTVDMDVGVNILLAWGWLVHHFSFLCADGETKIDAGKREFVDAVLQVGF